MADNVAPPVDAAGVPVFPIAPAMGRIALDAPVAGLRLPVPSVLLTLGAPAPTSLIYDATGALRAMALLPSMAPAGATTDTLALTAPAIAANISVADVATLAGVNGDAVRSRLLNAPLTVQEVPAGAPGAVRRLLAADRSRAATLAAVQAAALDHAASNLDPLHTAAAVLNATGALHSSTSSAAARALRGLRGRDLGVVAAALGVRGSNSNFVDSAGSLLLAPASDDTSQSLGRLLARSLDVVNARFDASLSVSPAANTGTSVTLSDALAGDVTLTTAAMNVSFGQGPLMVATNLAAPALVLAAPLAPAALTARTAAAGALTLPVSPPAVPSAAATVAATAAAGAVTLAPPAPAAAATVLNFNFFVDAVTQATNNITGNPNYAAMAAALYANAAVFRGTEPGIGAAQPFPGGADLPRPVGEATNIRPVRPV